MRKPLTPELVSTLYFAASNNELDQIKFLNDSGLDVHHDNSKSFLLACSFGHLDIVKYLLENGANINASSKLDYEPNTYSFEGNGLSLAVDNGDWKVYDYLLDKGIRVDLDNSLILKKMATRGHIDRIKHLIALGADVNKADALTAAIIDIRWNTAKYLITETNADIHAYDDFPLRNACYRGYADIIKLLVEKGANINAIPRVLEDTDEYGFNETALTGSIASENFDLFEYLIAKGADPNINNQEPFIHACNLDGFNPENSQFIEYYLENKLVTFNKEVFDAVVKGSKLELLKYFLNDYEKKNIDLDTLLDNETIYKANRIQIFEYLLSEGYEVSEKTREKLVRDNNNTYLSILLKYDLDRDLDINEKSGKKMKV